MWSVYGRSAPLFVLVAGAGLTLATRSPRPRARTEIAVRAVLLLLVGMALSTQVDGVILQSYALFFLVGLFALRLPSAALSALAATSLVGGPLLLTSLRRSGRVDDFATQADVGFEALTDPLALLEGLVLDHYPAVIWLGFFFTGMVLARVRITSASASRRLFLGGTLATAALFAVGWAGARVVGEPLVPGEVAVATGLTSGRSFEGALTGSSANHVPPPTTSYRRDRT